MDVTLEPMVVAEMTSTIHLPGGESQLAINPSTSPQVLRELATSISWDLRRLVASNPNTPTDILWQLGVDFPETVLLNPIFALLQLEHLQLAAQIPACTLTSMLQCDLVPIAFMEYALSQQDYSLWLAVAYNIITPGGLLKKLAQKARHQDRELIRAVAAHPNTPAQLLAEVVNIGAGVAQIVAENPQTPVAVLHKLLSIYGKNSDLHNVFVTLIALHPQIDTKLSIEMQLAPNPTAAAALSLAKDSTTTAEQLVALAETDWNVLHLAIVRHPNTPSAIVEQIWHQMQERYPTPNGIVDDHIWKEHRLIYDSFVCNLNTSRQIRGELRRLLR